jgi:hypothetical protein
MSFRGRLRLFFVLIVVVPIIALAMVLFVLTGRSQTGKADAGIASGVRTAFAVHQEQARQTQDEARRVAADPELRAALVEGRLGDARERIRELVGGGRGSHRDPLAVGRHPGAGRIAERGGP